MKDAVPNTELENCLKPAAQASSIPPEFYISDTVAQSELDNIFRGGWIGLGRADQVANPGDFTTHDLAGQNIILTRDKDGKIQALANTCRHRSARLVDGSGNCKGLRCPFHSWFYALDGRLVSAPHMEAAEGFDKSENGLIRYRAEERFGFVFVCLNPDSPDLDSHLGDFGELHAAWPLDTLVTARRRELEVECNWKAFLEVFNEYYHLAYVHPDSIDSIYAEPDPAEEVTGCFATQFGATEGTGGLLEGAQDNALPSMPGLTGRATEGARYTWVFPNMTFAANTDALWIYEAYPLGPNRCKVVQTITVPPETVASPGYERKISAYFERMDAALDEDIPALENQQRGLQSPDARPGRFQPLLEPNVASFARWYADKVS